MDIRGGRSNYPADPLEAFDEAISRVWKLICAEFDISADLPDFQSLFQGVEIDFPRAAAEIVVVNMLCEITQAVDRFSPWYTLPARAFGLTSVRNRQTHATHWKLAPEAVEKWCPLIESLAAEFDKKTGLIEAMLVIDELGLPDPEPEDSVLATCRCQPPREIIIKLAFLQGDGITCNNCLHPFLPVFD